MLICHSSYLLKFIYESMKGNRIEIKCNSKTPGFARLIAIAVFGSVLEFKPMNPQSVSRIMKDCV